MKKRAFAGVLLCLAVMQLAVQYPAPVISQDVTVDSTVSVTTVTATADLASLSQRDGMAVLIKTGANAGLWRYSKTSTATVDDTTVLNGPGSVGRFLQITIAPGAGSLDVLHDLTGKTAADLDPDATIEFVYYDVNEGTSYKVPLDELRKKGDVSTVANVAALFTATHARDNQLFQTLGYSTEGIGANLYRYDASSTATIDGGFVQPGIGGVLSFSGTTFNGTAGTGRFIAVDQTVADVAKFGATGASEAIDTAAFNRAVSVSSGGVVYFPTGVWTGQFTLSSVDNITIRGEGVSSKLICSAGDNVISAVSCTYITIEDLWIYGSGDHAANDLEKDDGIHASSCTGVAIKNCLVTNHGLVGILMVNSSDVRIDGNLIKDADGFDTSLSANCSDIFVYANQQITDVSITNNKCLSENNVGVMIQPVTDFDCHGVLISANECANHIKYGILTYVPMVADDDTTLRDVSVSVNSCHDNKFCGIYLNSTRNATVTGNALAHNYDGTADTNSGLLGSIFINGCSGVVVSSNSISGEKWYGIFVSGHSDRATMRSAVTVVNNTITDQQNTNYPAIWVSTLMTECSVIGNTIKGNLPTGIYIDGTSGQSKSVIVSYNQLDGVDIGATTSRGINLNGSLISGIVEGNKITNYYVALALFDNAVCKSQNNILTGCTYEMWLNGTFGTLLDVGNTYSTTLGSYTATTYTVDKDNVLTRNGVTERQGTGTPEGVVTAIVGSRFYRTDGGANTTLYVKESGTGNTGWVAK